MTVYAVFYVEYVEAIMEWSDHLEKLEKVFDSEIKAKEHVERKGGDYVMKELVVE